MKIATKYKIRRIKNGIIAVIVWIIFILGAVSFSLNIITDCQKAILQDELSQVISEQQEINNKLNEILKAYEKGE